MACHRIRLHQDTRSRESHTPSKPSFNRATGDAGAEKPLSIKEVVAAGFRATDSGSKAGLYAAESYTLLHFLATGEEGAFRPGLAEYLKESFMGKDSISNLEKALGLKSKEIEERWIEHVRGMS